MDDVPPPGFVQHKRIMTLLTRVSLKNRFIVGLTTLAIVVVGIFDGIAQTRVHATDAGAYGFDFGATAGPRSR
ncbi:hypothetical protein G7066_00975 [Leucobacter coleopterorum]|uniref:ABC transport system permease protein n=1 Tax=Leucobacter coleopterorum TaxID=2714933 RepID=A0ABX6JXR9_9MICO|nr:hypothetical protein [Leucobacter coleopterorum]QIM17639.1 hypothetical protein G7066_00975 [Leucobacter coleopterorum]